MLSIWLTFKNSGIDLSDENEILLNLRIVLKVLSLILTEWFEANREREL